MQEGRQPTAGTTLAKENADGTPGSSIGTSLPRLRFRRGARMYVLIVCIHMHVSMHNTRICTQRACLGSTALALLPGGTQRCGWWKEGNKSRCIYTVDAGSFVFSKGSNPSNQKGLPCLLEGRVVFRTTKGMKGFPSWWERGKNWRARPDQPPQQ